MVTADRQPGRQTYRDTVAELQRSHWIKWLQYNPIACGGGGSGSSNRVVACCTFTVLGSQTEQKDCFDNEPVRQWMVEW